ncbi:hypothetical protein Acr_07g0014170 [Actinidia rufa]|uniref:Uncharacterized protein n=1 Tax=Actinidia rufa TaxID=165716 RepID=A0A7J0EXL8_9ERIC|nr:hypothetical protein Acr_07g0014170 [Actinidia rufa]
MDPLEKFIPLKFTLYDGKLDPRSYMSHFKQMMALWNHLDALMYKVFPSSLGALGLKGFEPDPSGAFTNLPVIYGQVVINKKAPKGASSLLGLQKGKNEMLLGAIQRNRGMLKGASRGQLQPQADLGLKLELRNASSLALRVVSLMASFSLAFFRSVSSITELHQPSTARSAIYCRSMTNCPKAKQVSWSLEMLVVVTYLPSLAAVNLGVMFFENVSRGDLPPELGSSKLWFHSSRIPSGVRVPVELLAPPFSFFWKDPPRVPSPCAFLRMGRMESSSLLLWDEEEPWRNLDFGRRIYYFGLLLDKGPGFGSHVLVLLSLCRHHHHLQRMSA